MHHEKPPLRGRVVESADPYEKIIQYPTAKTAPGLSSGGFEYVKKLLPPPQGEVAERSEVGGGVVGFL